jgi:hypothetical protein
MQEPSNIELKDLQEAGLPSAATANLVVHVAWAPLRTPGMRVIDERGVVLVYSESLRCALSS